MLFAIKSYILHNEYLTKVKHLIFIFKFYVTFYVLIVLLNSISTYLTNINIYLSTEYRGYTPLYEDSYDAHKKGEDGREKEAPPFSLLQAFLIT